MDLYQKQCIITSCLVLLLCNCELNDSPVLMCNSNDYVTCSQHFQKMGNVQIRIQPI